MRLENCGMNYISAFMKSLIDKNSLSEIIFPHCVVLAKWVSAKYWVSESIDYVPVYIVEWKILQHLGLKSAICIC